MRDEAKPFICYKQGWNIKIFPRNSAGSKALGFWMAAVLSPVIVLIPLAIHFDDTPQERIIIWLTLPILLLMLGTIAAMIRWMLARSEMVKIDELLELKYQRDRKRKAGRN